MSSSGDTEAIFIATTQQQQLYCVLASSAVLLYDILITYDREVASIWKRKFSGVTFFFLNIRYATMLLQIALTINSILPGITISCNVTTIITYSMIVWSRFVCAAFGVFRTWAIWGRHWLVLAIFPFICFLTAAVNLTETTHLRMFSVPGPEPLGGCSAFFDFKTITLIRLSILARVGAVAGDAAILVAIWVKTWSIHRIIKATKMNAGQSNVSLSELLLRDGTAYFVAILCLNIPALVIDVIPSEVIFSPTTYFIDSFTAILLCRLMLNLRSFTMEDASITVPTLRHMTSVRFANVVLGNIGASVSVGEHDDDFDSDYCTRYSQVETTMEEAVNDPLAIGLEGNIRCTQHGSSSEDFAELTDGNRGVPFGNA